MKKIFKTTGALLGIAVAIFLSIAPKYYVYAEDQDPTHVVVEQPDQTVTSDDNIVQKLMNFTFSCWGVVAKTNSVTTTLTQPDGVVQSRVKDTIAQLMNGGGIYVDENGNYVFSNEASQQIYDSMMANSNVDAKVVSNFNDFTTFADGYVNSTYLGKCNELIAWAKTYGVTQSSFSDLNYILFAGRYENNDYVYTRLAVYPLQNTFGFMCINNYRGATDGKYGFQAKTTASGTLYLNFKDVTCSYQKTTGNYSVTNNNNIQNNSDGYFQSPTWSTILYDNSFNRNDVYSSFPYFNNINLNDNVFYYSASYYCNNSLILSKDVANGTSLLNQSDGIYSSYKNIGTINKNTITNNNWESIYNNYITNVNIDYEKDPSMSASDLRKIMKKYTTSITDAITQGTENIEESISISNRYLQAISVDVRNIIDYLNENGGGGSGNGNGLTEEQYNTLVDLLTNIKDHSMDIASNTDGSYLELQDISDNSANTNVNLVQMKAVLDQINSKIRNRKTDNPLPDPDFWDNLEDDLIDVTNTKLEDLISTLQTIGTVLQGVVPFGYVMILGTILTSLAHDPEPPVFEINYDTSSIANSSNVVVPFQWSGSIDLTWLADIVPMLRAFEVILFIIGLVWASFTIFTTLGSLFS